jgi:hypothetical protein
MSLTQHLTGKCEQEFEQWLYDRNNPASNKRIDYTESPYGFGCGYDGCETDIDLSDIFYNLPPSSQFGVIQDFFKSKEIYVTMIPNWKKEQGFSIRVGFHIVSKGQVDSFFIRPENNSVLFTEFKNYEQAREAAVKAFNTIYNNE